MASTDPPLPAYRPETLSADEVARLPGEVLLDFGTDWCGHCQAAGPLVARALAQRTALRHLRVEDGRGRPLGRHHGVKLWPTLILLRDGVEAGRVVRPQAQAEIEALLGPRAPSPVRA